MTPVFQIPGLHPYYCLYRMENGRRTSITLYAATARQLLSDWSGILPGLEIEGIVHGVQDQRT